MRPPEDPAAVLATARLVHDERAVSAALDRMAGVVAERYAALNPLLLTIMIGGMYTAVELAKRLRFPFEMAFVQASRYGAATAGGELSWPVPPDSQVRGRHVLVIDDVLDAGVTLADLYRLLDALGPASKAAAVLVLKELPGMPDRPGVDIVGLEAGPEFLFGCGMDCAGYWRGLPAIYSVV